MRGTLPNWQERYNAKLIITVRVRLLDRPGTLAEFLEAVANAGASVGDIRIAETDSTHKIRDIQLYLVDEERLDAAVRAIYGLDHAELIGLTDEVLDIHRRGTIETHARVPLRTIADLRMVYTPGVASVCQLIAEKPEEAWEYTGKGRRIAIVTNGTAVLGLGDIGPLAGLPVMEGKAAILAHFAKVSGDAILIQSKDPKEIVGIVSKIAPGYGAIQLEDIAAPECFQIEEELQALLDIPVFHDDQHGTATVVVAGLINALRQTGRRAEETSAVILGAGAAGSAIARFLVDFGLDDVVVCDSAGAIHRGRTKRMNPWKERLAEMTNRDNIQGDVAATMRGRGLFIGVSKPNVLTKEMVASMDEGAIVFALANPVSEIPVADALEAGAAVAVDGRGMNNALAYPGIFRGALDARARRITHEMKLAAARALADAAGTRLLPEMLDPAVHQRVARAVAEAAAPSQDPGHRAPKK